MAIIGNEIWMELPVGEADGSRYPLALGKNILREVLEYGLNECAGAWQ